MKLFHPDARYRSEAHQRLYAYTEFAYTLVDVAAAVMFIGGSILFFDSATVELATWLFLIGSIFFALRPSIRLWREIRYLRMGDYDDVAGAQGR